MSWDSYPTTGLEDWMTQLLELGEGGCSGLGMTSGARRRQGRLRGEHAGNAASCWKHADNAASCWKHAGNAAGCWKHGDGCLERE